MIRVYYDRGNIVAVFKSNPYFVIGFLDKEQRSHIRQNAESCIKSMGWNIKDFAIDISE